MDELSLGWLALLMLLACPLMMIGMGLFAWLAGSRLFGGQGGHAGHTGHGMMCHMMGHGSHHDHRHSEESRASESGEGAPSGDSPKSM